MNYKKIMGAVAALGVGATLAACSAEKAPGSKSGYDYAIPETQAMQGDNFNNPAMLWVGIAEEEWKKKSGEAKKACADCHGAAKGSKSGGDSGMYQIEPYIESMRGVTAKNFPKQGKDGKFTTLEEQIMACQTNQQKAAPWKWESDQMLGMTALIKMQSRGMPIVAYKDADEAGDPAHAAWAAGKKYFEERRGLLDMACQHCHGEYPGAKIRANVLSQAQINGFPTYRLKWQKPGSLHRRYKGCNNEVRAEPQKEGSDIYKNLEVYMSWRSRGQLVEAPAVRN